MLAEDRPTIAERHASAVEASNLKVSTLTRGPIDVIIAAGWCGDGMGAMLMRLRSEYDTVAADVRGMGDSSLTDHLLVLAHLKTLRATREALWDLALKQAEVIGFDRPEKDARAVVGRCLEVFLDPNCRPCEGRGFNVGDGKKAGAKVICRRCKGAGRRRGEVGRDDVERAYAGRLLNLMDRSVSFAEGGMAASLRDRDHAVE